MLYSVLKWVRQQILAIIIAFMSCIDKPRQMNKREKAPVVYQLQAPVLSVCLHGVLLDGQLANMTLYELPSL